MFLPVCRVKHQYACFDTGDLLFTPWNCIACGFCCYLFVCSFAVVVVCLFVVVVGVVCLFVCLFVVVFKKFFVIISHFTFTPSINNRKSTHTTWLLLE